MKVLMDHKGMWMNPSVSCYCYSNVHCADRVKLFETCESLYREMKIPPTSFNKEEMDKNFKKHLHLQQMSTFKNKNFLD